MNEKPAVEITEDDNVAVIAFKATSISNPEGIAAASAQIDDFIDQNHPKAVIVDFSQVKFFSSQVLGMLVKVRSRLKEYNGNVVISAIEPQLHRVFKITKLDQIFSFFSDKEKAVSAISSGEVFS